MRNIIKTGAWPRTDNLVALADTANVNIEWLAAGRGPKKRGDTTPYVPTDADGIPQRIRIWRESLRMTQSAFAAALDLTVYPIRDWEVGEKPVDAKALKAIAETGANIDWLRTGKGEMRSGIPVSGLTRNRMEYITPNSLDAEFDSATEPPSGGIASPEDEAHPSAPSLGANLAKTVIQQYLSTQMFNPISWLPPETTLSTMRELSVSAQDFVTYHVKLIGNSNSKLKGYEVPMEAVEDAVHLAYKRLKQD